jgi:two-component system sensor kinase
LFFFFYCFFSGLIVPDAGFFPASVLNYTVCAENIGLYVQVFRTLCALVIAFGMIKVLQVFEVETIDELKKAYGELENRTSELGLANALLHQTNRELEAFTYSVSHDLRAPLRIINGFSEMVLESYGQRLDEKGRSLLNMIRSNVNRMDGLILALLALSKVTRQEMKIGELDLGRLAKEVFSELRTTESGHAIHFDIKALPPVNADLLLMRQVFTNLLSNAIKFSSMKNSAEIEVGGSSEGSENIYYVKDNGAGFDMEYADKLFGVFQRLHSSREFEGTGIGLSIVRRIIQRHGGRVWAEGKPNEGAIFYFSLPRGESHS